MAVDEDDGDTHISVNEANRALNNQLSRVFERMEEEIKKNYSMSNSIKIGRRNGLNTAKQIIKEVFSNKVAETEERRV